VGRHENEIRWAPASGPPKRPVLYALSWVGLGVILLGFAIPFVIDAFTGTSWSPFGIPGRTGNLSIDWAVGTLRFIPVAAAIFLGWAIRKTGPTRHRASPAAPSRVAFTILIVLTAALFVFGIVLYATHAAAWLLGTTALFTMLALVGTIITGEQSGMNSDD
jgi:hypothetical protein